MDEEKKKCVPVHSIIDSATTANMKAWLENRGAQLRGDRIVLSDPHADSNAKRIVDERRKRLKSLAKPEFQQAVRQMHGIMNDQGCSYAKAFKMVMEDVVRDCWRRDFPLLPRLNTSKSIMFMAVWLSNYYDYRRSLDTAAGHEGISDKVLVNETVDLHYLVLLTRAEGLVSEDGGMIETAGAFFPGRLIVRKAEVGNSPTLRS